MIFRIFITVFVVGFVLLVALLSVMRELYARSVCQPPHLLSDAPPNPSLDEEHERLEIGNRSVSSCQREIEEQACTVLTACGRGSGNDLCG
jgi:hypothetical protein